MSLDVGIGRTPSGDWGAIWNARDETWVTSKTSTLPDVLCPWTHVKIMNFLFVFGGGAQPVMLRDSALRSHIWWYLGTIWNAGDWHVAHLGSIPGFPYSLSSLPGISP